MKAMMIDPLVIIAIATLIVAVIGVAKPSVELYSDMTPYVPSFVIPGVDVEEVIKCVPVLCGKELNQVYYDYGTKSCVYRIGYWDCLRHNILWGIFAW